MAGVDAGRQRVRPAAAAPTALAIKCASGGRARRSCLAGPVLADQCSLSHSYSPRPNPLPLRRSGELWTPPTTVLSCHYGDGHGLSPGSRSPCWSTCFGSARWATRWSGCYERTASCRSSQSGPPSPPVSTIRSGYLCARECIAWATATRSACVGGRLGFILGDKPQRPRFPPLPASLS